MEDDGDGTCEEGPSCSFAMGDGDTTRADEGGGEAGVGCDGGGVRVGDMTLTVPDVLVKVVWVDTVEVVFGGGTGGVGPEAASAVVTPGTGWPAISCSTNLVK